MISSPDYGVYLVTDRKLCLGKPLMDVVYEAVAGGVGVVQLREKSIDTREFVELACALKAELASKKIPLLINDRIDVALACRADGVHIGQSDMPYPLAREILGPKAIIGLSVETEEQVREAETWDVNYFGVSPIFATPTKTDTGQPWGIDGLRRLKTMTRHTLVGIGGLSDANASEVIAAGADGIAVVSAICSAASPREAATRLRYRVEEARGRSVVLTAVDSGPME